MFVISVLQLINSAENMPISVESILEMKLKFHEKREFVLHKYTENLQEAILKILNSGGSAGSPILGTYYG